MTLRLKLRLLLLSTVGLASCVAVPDAPENVDEADDPLARST